MNNPKFKIGDRVRVVRNDKKLVIVREVEWWDDSDFDKYKNKLCTIKKIHRSAFYGIYYDLGITTATEQCIELAEHKNTKPEWL